jgi:cytochrome c biogenesis protein CcdA
MEWAGQALQSSHFSLAALGAAALLGVVMAVGSCCNLPVLAAVAGYAGSRDGGNRTGLRSAGFGIFLGIVAAMTLLGLVIGSAGRFLGSVQGDAGRITAGFIFLLFGLWALDWVPFRLPRITIGKKMRPGGMMGAALFGFAAGGATVLCSLCCSAPLVPILAGLASAKGSVLWGGSILLMVSIGYGLALTALLLGVSLGRTAVFMKKIEKGVRLVSGFALLAAGFWLLAKG